MEATWRDLRRLPVQDRPDHAGNDHAMLLCVRRGLADHASRWGAIVGIYRLVDSTRITACSRGVGGLFLVANRPKPGQQLTKLDVSSRSAATSWAFTNNLVTAPPH